MTLPKLLLLSTLTSILLFAGNDLPKSDCPVKIEYEVTEAKNNVYNLSIKASGGVEPYTYLLLDRNGKPESVDFKKKEFEGLARGEYRCIVLDRNECRKEVSIEIK